MENKSNLSSVQNALRILDCFTIEQTEKRVTQIANELDIGKSTVSRLLKTLSSVGYVKKDEETQKYSLGTKVLTLYSALMSNMEVVKEAKSTLEQLANETSESVQLAEIEGSNVIYIDQIKSSFPIQIFAHIGRINPIHCTSSGKLLLAYQKDSTIEDILKNELIQYTQSTITNPEILKKELKEIRDLGYCYLENEFIDGIVSISAPIKDYNKNIIAAVSIVGPIQRINQNKSRIFINKVVEAAKNISVKMGYN